MSKIYTASEWIEKTKNCKSQDDMYYHNLLFTEGIYKECDNEKPTELVDCFKLSWPMANELRR